MFCRRLANAILFSTVLHIGWPGAAAHAHEESVIGDLGLTRNAQQAVSLVVTTAADGPTPTGVSASSMSVRVLTVRDQRRLGEVVASDLTSNGHGREAASGVPGREPRMRAANAKLRRFDGPVDLRPTSGFGGQREILP